MQKLLFLTILFFLYSSSFLISQEKKEYKEKFQLLINSSNKDNYELNIKEFYDTLDNYKRAKAMQEIAKDENTNFIAHNVLLPNNKKLSEGAFRKSLIEDLTNIERNPNYEYVLINFLSKHNKKDDEYLEEFNDKLYELANGEETDNAVRFYAASKYGISNDFEKSHKNLINMFRGKNLYVKNGVAKALTRFLYSEKISQAEKDKWENLLIKEIDANKDSLQEVKSMLSAVSQTGTKTSKKYLFELFKTNARINKDNANILLDYLSNEMDVDLLNNVFSECSKYSHFNDFTTELKFQNIVQKNLDLLDELRNKNTDNGRLNFLKAAKYIQVDKRENYLEYVQQSLESKSEEERYECIKTLHLFLNNDEERQIYNEHLIGEKSELIKSLIYNYIGE